MMAKATALALLLAAAPEEMPLHAVDPGVSEGVDVGAVVDAEVVTVCVELAEVVEVVEVVEVDEVVLWIEIMSIYCWLMGISIVNDLEPVDDGLRDIKSF
jgi:hypothetical protein